MDLQRRVEKKNNTLGSEKCANIDTPYTNKIMTVNLYEMTLFFSCCYINTPIYFLIVGMALMFQDSAEEKRLLSLEKLLHRFLPSNMPSEIKAKEAQSILLFASNLSKVSVIIVYFY